MEYRKKCRIIPRKSFQYLKKVLGDFPWFSLLFLPLFSCDKNFRTLHIYFTKLAIPEKAKLFNQRQLYLQSLTGKLNRKVKDIYKIW